MQNVVSFHVPLLLKPIFDIKNPESSFLICMQAGAVHPITRKMVELGIPRETAIYLYQIIYSDKKDIENIEEKDIRKNILEKFNEFPYWIRVQLDFLR